MTRINKILIVIKRTQVFAFINNYCIFLLYAIVNFLLNLLLGGKSQQLTSNIVNLLVTNVSVIFVSLALAFMFERKFDDINDVIDIYIGAGTFQGCLGILCFIFPSVKIFLNTMMVNGSTEKIARSVIYTSAFRNYGFASTLYDIFGFAMSLLTILAIYRALNGEKKYFVNAAIIGFTAILNARTSIVMIALGLAFLMVFSGEPKKDKIRNMFLISWILIPIFVYVLIYLSTRESDSAKWLFSGIEEIKTLVFDHKATGYFAALQNFVFFSQNLFDLLIGTGMTPQQKILVTSDVGYIQNIWQFGIIGSVIEYCVFVKLFLDAKKIVSKSLKSLLSCILLLIVIYLIKLNCLGYSMASVIYLPFILYVFVVNYKTRSAI